MADTEQVYTVLPSGALAHLRERAELEDTSVSRLIRLAVREMYPFAFIPKEVDPQ